MTDAITQEQIQLLRDIRMNGAINGLLFSKHRSAGPSLRSAGLITGVGDGTFISSLGYEALRSADKALRANPNGEPK